MDDITKQVRERERERERACEWIEWNKGCLQSTRGKGKVKVNWKVFGQSMHHSSSFSTTEPSLGVLS
jgi:hypothetical protein